MRTSEVSLQAPGTGSPPPHRCCHDRVRPRSPDWAVRGAHAALPQAYMFLPLPTALPHFPEGDADATSRSRACLRAMNDVRRDVRGASNLPPDSRNAGREAAVGVQYSYSMFEDGPKSRDRPYAGCVTTRCGHQVVAGRLQEYMPCLAGTGDEGIGDEYQSASD